MKIKAKFCSAFALHSIRIKYFISDEKFYIAKPENVLHELADSTVGDMCITDVH